MPLGSIYLYIRMGDRLVGTDDLDLDHAHTHT